MNPKIIESDVFVVGGGPAGLAAAILAAEKGFRVAVADHAVPPIDKACGEGLMPDAVAALRGMGVSFGANEAAPFRGIRFHNGATHVEAEFHNGVGIGVRRTILHAKLVERATQAGVAFAWGARVTGLDTGEVFCNGAPIRSRWIIGADGQESRLRRWVAPRPRFERIRFGSRQRFETAPWSDFVETYWGQSCQAVVAAMGPREICVAVTSDGAPAKIAKALLEIPELRGRLGGARATTRERGAASALRTLKKVHRGRCVLIGDASGSVDPIAGEGLGLAFQQAHALTDALADGDLREYEAAHRRIGRIPRFMSGLLLILNGNRWLRDRTIRAFAAEPYLFSRLLNIHVREFPPSAFGVGDAMRLGWLLLANPGWEI